MSGKEAGERFWDVALRVYGQNAAREAFLRLQDRDGADVPILLWCLWLAGENRQVSREVMERAVSFSAAWHSAAVNPLRRVRRALKSGVSGVSAALSTDARELVAKTEIALERLQMIHLSELSDAGGTDAVGDPASELTALYADVAALSLDPGDLGIIAEAASR